jgi:hypothetical protein
MEHNVVVDEPSFHHMHQQGSKNQGEITQMVPILTKMLPILRLSLRLRGTGTIFVFIWIGNFPKNLFA